jgi:integrase
LSSLSTDPSGNYHVHFRYGGRQFHKSLKTDDEKTAEAMRGRIDLTLRDLELGRLALPAGADFWQFLQSDGKLDSKPRVEKAVTLDAMFKWYFGSQTRGAKEPKTLQTERLHSGHLLRLLGKTKSLSAIRGHDLQDGYINQRAGESYRKKSIRPETIEKEINTLGMVWRRAAKLGLVDSQPPTNGLVYPKGKEKLPFQTWEEIQRNIARGSLNKTQVREQWDTLFLSRRQIEEILEFTKGKKLRSAYFYPLMVFVAHTGARRSEVIRSRVEDLKFDDGQDGHVVIREKKKSQGKETYRRVPMSPLLREVLQEYMQRHHPGGSVTFCLEPDKPMVPNALQEMFRRRYKKSKWDVLRGYHVFRHSLASNLAREGVDQRTIDELMGHQTEEMRKRYRHFFPEQRENAIRKLFG